MLGSYLGASQRRLVPNGQGVAALAGVQGHFDGRRDLFVLDAGPSPQSLAVGSLINAGLPFGAVNTTNGLVRFETSHNGKNRPGVRIEHLSSAPVAVAPHCSYPMRDGGFGDDASWTVGFVYTWAATTPGGGSEAQIFEFVCNNVEVRFYLYPNGVCLWAMTADADGVPEIYAVSGATAAASFTDTTDVYAMLFSHSAANGFYFRNVNLTNFLEASYTEPQAYKPSGYATAKARAEGNGTCVFGITDNMKPSGTKDWTIHEAFYAGSAVLGDAVTSLLQDWSRKWVANT